MSIGNGTNFCECGQYKEKYEDMCPECKSWSKKIPRQKKVGKKEPDSPLSFTVGKCLKCGGKCAPRATLCQRCFRGGKIALNE